MEEHVDGDSHTTLGLKKDDLGETQLDEETILDKETEEAVPLTDATESTEAVPLTEEDVPTVTEVPTEDLSTLSAVVATEKNSKSKSRKRKFPFTTQANREKRKSKKAETDTDVHHKTLRKIDKMEKEMKRLTIKVNKIQKHLPRCMR